MNDFAALAPQMVSFLSVLTVLGQIISAVLIVALLTGWPRGVETFVSKKGLLLMLIVALTGTLGSLFFSEIAGWTPCRLCWFQRIFLYPQVVILGVALWKRDRSVALTILILSLIGIVIAALHYNEQVMAALYPPVSDLPCDDTGVSCASTPFFHFGYITIPMMALTAFVLNALGAVVLLRKRS